MKSKEIPGMFEGPIIPVSIKLGLPIIIGNLFSLLYMVADTYFISLIDQSSTALLSGTGLMFPVFGIYMAAGSSIYIAVSSIIGRIIGSNEHELAPSVTASGFLIAGTIGLPVLIVTYAFGGDFIEVLSGGELSQEALNFGVEYFYCLLPGLSIIIFYQVYGGVLQGEGLTRIIALAGVCSTVTNILLDPIFIFVLDMGVAGAGLATTASICIAGVFVIWYALSGKSALKISFDIRRAKFKMVKEILRIGFPEFVDMATLSISFMILSKLISGISEVHMNAWTLVGRIDQILIIPVIGIAMANITMVAQNFGRNKLGRTRSIYWRNILLSGFLTVSAAILYIALADWIFPLFSNVPEVLESAVEQVRYMSFTFLGIAVGIISGSFFQAIGHPLPALFIPLLRMGAVTLPLALLTVQYWDMEMIGIYISLGVGNIFTIPLSLFLVTLYFKKLNFKATP